MCSHGIPVAISCHCVPIIEISPLGGLANIIDRKMRKHHGFIVMLAAHVFSGRAQMMDPSFHFEIQ